MFLWAEGETALAPGCGARSALLGSSANALALQNPAWRGPVWPAGRAAGVSLSLSIAPNNKYRVHRLEKQTCEKTSKGERANVQRQVHAGGARAGHPTEVSPADLCWAMGPQPRWPSALPPPLSSGEDA